MTEQRDDEKKRRADADAITAAAAIIFHNGRYAEALEMFDRAVAMDFYNARAQGGRCLALTQLGRPDEALHAAEIAIGCDPSYAPSYTALAYCYHRLGKPEEAQKAFERALALDPDEPRVLYNVACFWAERRDEGKCRTYLERAFRVVENHTLDHAANDPDLARYAEKEWFRELVTAAKLRRARARKTGGEEPTERK